MAEIIGLHPFPEPELYRVDDRLAVEDVRQVFHLHLGYFFGKGHHQSRQYLGLTELHGDALPDMDAVVEQIRHTIGEGARHRDWQQHFGKQGDAGVFGHRL